MKNDHRTAKTRRIDAGREQVRTRLRAFEYVRRLREVADKCEAADPSQIPGMRLKADIYARLLAKVLPDLKSVEHSGSVEHRHVQDMTDAELAAIAAGSSQRIIEAEERATLN